MWDAENEDDDVGKNSHDGRGDQLSLEKFTEAVVGNGTDMRDASVDLIVEQCAAQLHDLLVTFFLGRKEIKRDKERKNTIRYDTEKGSSHFDRTENRLKDVGKAGGLGRVDLEKRGDGGEKGTLELFSVDGLEQSISADSGVEKIVDLVKDAVDILNGAFHLIGLKEGHRARDQLGKNKPENSGNHRQHKGIRAKQGYTATQRRGAQTIPDLSFKKSEKGIGKIGDDKTDQHGAEDLQDAIQKMSNLADEIENENNNTFLSRTIAEKAREIHDLAFDVLL